MNFTQSFKLAIKSLLLSKMRALADHAGHHHRRGGGHHHHQPGQRHAELHERPVRAAGLQPDPGDGLRPRRGRHPGREHGRYVRAWWRSTPSTSLALRPMCPPQPRCGRATEDFDRTSIYGVSEAFYRADTQKTMQGVQPGEWPLPPATLTWSAIRMCVSSVPIWRKTLSGRDAAGSDDFRQRRALHGSGRTGGERRQHRGQRR